jgi:hypothetical protein
LTATTVKTGVPIPGPQGIQGTAGTAGTAGATGAQGLIGVPGFDGEDGVDAMPIPGPQGIQGVPGMIGKAGATALAANFSIQFPVQMWKVPTVTYFTPTAAGAQCWRFSGAAAAAQTATASRANSTTDRGVVVTATGDAGGAVGDLVGVHYTADAEFIT